MSAPVSAPVPGRVGGRVSRRAALGLLGAAVLGACGTPAPGIPAPGIPAPAGPAAAGAGARVVTLVPALLDAALAVGVRPVLAAVVGSTLPPHLTGLADGVPLTNAGVGVDLERVARERPDLILTQTGPDDHADLLRRIAPTAEIAVPQPAARWREYVAAAAAAMDRAPATAAAEQELARHVAGARTVLAGRPGTVSVLQVDSDGVRVYGPDSFAGSLLREAGATTAPTPPGVSWNADGYLGVSRERLAEVAGDTVFLLVRVAEGEDDAEVARDPLWRSLPAVRAGRTVTVDRGTWVHRGYASAARVLDDAARSLRG